MHSMNSVFLMGNLTRDPESRKLPSGSTVADLGLAVSDNYKDKEGKLVERAVFVDVVTWDRQAETCCNHLKKGSPVLVEGKLQLDQWQTEAGEKRNRLRVRAHRVQFLGRPAGARGNPVAAAAPEAADGEEQEAPF